MLCAPDSFHYPNAVPLDLAFLQSLPKTDLHCHLDGSLRLETILELAKKHRVSLPTFDPALLHRQLYAGERTSSLDEYLKAFAITTSVLQTEDALERAAFELAQDAAAEAVRYLEVRFSPLLHLQKSLSPSLVIEAVLRGLRMAERSYKIRCGLILCAIRSDPPANSFRIAELCVAFKHRGVVAFDLAGSEEGNPAKEHRAAFQLVIDNNINCTAHAGESFGPDSIHQAIHKCGAHRIGHGTHLPENGELLNYVNDHRIPLEVCPSSNLQTAAAKSWQTHPVDFFVDYGLRVTINTDNRLITGTTVSQELHHCVTHYDWPLETVKRVLLSGFKSAFLPYRERRDLLIDMNRELATVAVITGPKAPT